MVKMDFTLNGTATPEIVRKNTTTINSLNSNDIDSIIVAVREYTDIQRKKLKNTGTIRQKARLNNQVQLYERLLKKLEKLQLDSNT